MLLGAYRLLLVDLHQDRKAALVLSLLVYGAALMVLPRLTRARAPQRPAKALLSLDSYLSRPSKTL